MPQIILVCIVLGSGTGAAFADGPGGAQARATQSAVPPADWWSVDKAVVEHLFHEDVGAFAAKLASLATSDPIELMRRVSIYVRAGHETRAAEAMESLAAARIGDDVVTQAVDFLIEHEQRGIARRFLERHPKIEPGRVADLARYWTKGGAETALDDWLAARADGNRSFWTLQRVALATSPTAREKVLESLAADVRRHPQDTTRAKLYLEAVERAGTGDNLEWLGQSVQPTTAFECWEMGSRLHRCPRAAITLLERSLSLPYTARDEAPFAARIHFQAPIPGSHESYLRRDTKSGLAQCYVAIGEHTKAQPILEALTDVKNGLPPVGLGRLAGQVQKQTGSRVIEGRIKTSEPAHRESTEYWRMRAEYFAGRGEDAAAREAFAKALSLAPANQDVRGKTTFERHLVLGSYSRYLRQKSDVGAAMRLVRREFDGAEPGGVYAQYLIGDLLALENDISGHLKQDDAGLWAYLAARREWRHTEERLLWRMVRNAPNADRDKAWARAEALVRDSDPTRAKTLGWIMTRTEAAARSIPWLSDAVARLPPGDERLSAAITLLEAHLDTGDWRAAERVWPIAREHLTPREIPQWYGRVAICAAKAGAKEDALRIWRAKTNLDRTDVRGMDELIRLGLKAPLRKLYRDIQAEGPVSTAPRAALNSRNYLPPRRPVLLGFSMM